MVSISWSSASFFVKFGKFFQLHGVGGERDAAHAAVLCRRARQLRAAAVRLRRGRRGARAGAAGGGPEREGEEGEVQVMYD